MKTLSSGNGESKAWANAPTTTVNSREWTTPGYLCLKIFVPSFLEKVLYTVVNDILVSPDRDNTALSMLA